MLWYLFAKFVQYVLGLLLVAAVFLVASKYFPTIHNPLEGKKDHSSPGVDGSSPSFAPLFRYWKEADSDHFYTTNWGEIDQVIPNRRGRHDYAAEGIACMLITRRVSHDTVPLYRYYKEGCGDHFYTTNSQEIGTTSQGQIGKHGYKYEGIAGYCYSTPTEDTVPLYRYWQPNTADHFYTTNSAAIGTTTDGQIGKYGYKSEGIACYVYHFDYHVT